MHAYMCWLPTEAKRGHQFFLRVVGDCRLMDLGTENQTPVWDKQPTLSTTESSLQLPLLLVSDSEFVNIAR